MLPGTVVVGTAEKLQPILQTRVRGWQKSLKSQNLPHDIPHQEDTF